MIFPDISFHQGNNVNFNTMRMQTDYLILRAGQGQWLDTCFKRNRDECIRVGLPYGVYWFYDDRVSPAKQAETLYGLLKTHPLPKEIWCDWERTYSGEYGGLDDVVAFMERIESLTGMTCGMYTGYYWFLENSNKNQYPSQYRYLESKPLWLAWYTDDFTENGIEKVKIPPPFKEMDVWQYGTPSLAYKYGVTQSIEIDMNKRLTPFVIPLQKRKMIATFGDKQVEYNNV